MKYILPLLFIAFGFKAAAQPVLYDAQESARALEGGILVVRLFWQKDRVEHLRRSGSVSEYEQVVEEINDYNTKIIEAFRSHYSFGDVAFMDSDDSRLLIEGEWEGILQDYDGNVLEIEPTDYLVADFSQTKNMSLRGLNLWQWDGQHWVNPPSPFPSFVSKYGFMGFYTRTPAEVVEKWSDLLMGR